MTSGTTSPRGLTGLLVGFGSIGRRHITNLHALGVRDWAVVHTGAGTLPFDPPCPVRTYPDLAQALDAEEPDFAVVANPTALHLPTAVACVERGCHLLLEKPVSHTLDGLDGLSALVRQRGRRVLVGFQFRFHPALQRIEGLLRAGELGHPLHARVVWGEYLPDWHPWEDWRLGYAARADLGGGVHHTICHPFDYLRMLFADPVEVRGVLSPSHPLGLDVPESADVLLRFASDVEASVHLDYWTRPRVHRVEIVATEGSLCWDYIGGSFQVWDRGGKAWHAETLPGVDARNDLFLALSRHFLEIVTGQADPVCSLDDGVQAVRIALAVERSSAHAAEPIQASTEIPG